MLIHAPHAIATDSQGSIYVAEVSYAEFGSQMKPPRGFAGFVGMRSNPYRTI